MIGFFTAAELALKMKMIYDGRIIVVSSVPSSAVGAEITVAKESSVVAPLLQKDGTVTMGKMKKLKKLRPMAMVAAGQVVVSEGQQAAASSSSAAVEQQVAGSEVVSSSAAAVPSSSATGGWQLLGVTDGESEVVSSSAAVGNLMPAGSGAGLATSSVPQGSDKQRSVDGARVVVAKSVIDAVVVPWTTMRSLRAALTDLHVVKGVKSVLASGKWSPYLRKFFIGLRRKCYNVVKEKQTLTFIDAVRYFSKAGEDMKKFVKSGRFDGDIGDLTASSGSWFCDLRKGALLALCIW